MPKTPDEIKKGMEITSSDCLMCECCVTDCPYDLECHPGNEETNTNVPKAMLHDALALIQQLEAELADTKKAVGYTNGLCDICKHKNEHENECEANDFLCYNCPADCACKECYSDASHYEWRGVQKEE